MPEQPTCNGCGQPISFKQREDGSWLRFNADGTPHNHVRKMGSGGGGRPGRSEAELHDIRREAVLNSAVAYVVGKMQASPPEVVEKITGKTVVETAKAFLAFVEEGRPQQQ